MKQEKDIQQLLENFIGEERNIESNPFLSTRVMAAIAKNGIQDEKRISPVWKTVMIGAGLVVAVFTGITIGSIYQSGNERPGVVLMNDNNMEHFGFYEQMVNE